jgi:hypothetical protein
MDLAEIFNDNISSVLYVGASVTAQREGFRPEFHNILQLHVGHEVPFYVNALGGVGSMFGLTNIKLERNNYKNVELIILEYSTGDLNLWITPRDIFHEVLHELFQECYKITNRIIVLHNFRSDFLGTKAAIIHDCYNSYAYQFGAQVVDLHQQISSIVSTNPQWLKINYRDHVHTTENGAIFVANTLFEAIKNDYFLDFSIIKNLEIKSIGLEYHSIANDSIAAKVEEEYIYPSTGQSFKFIKIPENSSISFDFSGEIYGLLTIVGPRSSTIKLNIKDKEYNVTLFDRNCHYYRVHCLPIRIKSAELAQLRISQLKILPDFNVCKIDHVDFSKDREARICGFIGAKLIFQGGASEF